MPLQMQETLQLWDVFKFDDIFEVVISQLVESEIDACPEEKLDMLASKMVEIQYTCISQTAEVTDLAEQYLDFGVLTPKNRNDLLHIAHATVSGCTWIASWNFKHFVNFKTMNRVNGVHLFLGYNPVKIATPSMILGELDNE